ncbi:UNVERIFIED_CONTAM: hypothetical protein HHA_450120 [Hammondia hammondi]|eukprot:XP_008889045.1 hypothetical protein HHA_450120 [Hammondia hammondi]
MVRDCSNICLALLACWHVDAQLNKQRIGSTAAAILPFKWVENPFVKLTPSSRTKVTDHAFSYMRDASLFRYYGMGRGWLAGNFG